MKEIFHESWYFGFFLRWRYSNNSLVSPLMTANAHLFNTINGKFLDASFLGVAVAVRVSIHANTSCYVNVLAVRPLACVLFLVDLRHLG